jgi:hypothetical protein
MSGVSPPLVWKKAKKSDSNGSCIEVARLADGGAKIRDSKDNGSGPVLSFTRAEWDAFVDGMEHREFELPE